MTMLREAAQQALEALELAQTDVHWELNSPTRKFLRKAEKALRAALAESVQEPYAWMAVGGSIWRHKTSEDDVPLFTTPQYFKP